MTSMANPRKTTIHRIALAGNPNVGKSTIFNELTGGNQHVGNWPGKTVERHEGWFEQNNERFNLVDLPGIYSLSAYSPDEEVARDYIVRSRPDLIVNVVDATNLERNLYLTVQILETDTPLLIALNMQDLAKRRGFGVDSDKLTQMLAGTPVIMTSAAKGLGLDDLREAIWKLTRLSEPNAPVEEFNSVHGGNGVLSHCHS